MGDQPTKQGVGLVGVAEVSNAVECVQTRHG